ncbi:MAG: MerR family transcriptional regulator, partial [Oscillospiraceae bacterium]|nr:MerR family transcriptional regulator [Oscillospiraceae bacterium]
MSISNIKEPETMSENTQEDDLLTITEFADIVGMTANALRHYDKKGVFRPATRGVKFQNEYRYYAPTQFMVAKMIRVLTDIEVPLDEIVELAKNRTPETVIKLFRKHKEKVQNKIEFLQEALSVISTFLELLIEGISATETEISVIRMPEKRIIMGDTNGYADSGSFYQELRKFYCAQHEPKLNLSYPVGGYFGSMDEFMNEPSQPARFFSLDPKGNDRIAEGL